MLHSFWKNRQSWKESEKDTMIKKEGSMDDTTAQTPQVSKSKRGGYGCAFFFCLIFLIGGAMPALLNFPGVQARFTGMETTALVTADVSCSWTDSNNNVSTGYD